MKHASKGIHPGFEAQGKHHQKSKRSISWTFEKELLSSKTFFKKGGGGVCAEKPSERLEAETAHVRSETVSALDYYASILTTFYFSVVYELYIEVMSAMIIIAWVKMSIL